MRLTSLGLIAAYLSFVYVARSQSAPRDFPPREVIVQFCAFDSEGIRFDPNLSQRIEKLLSRPTILKQAPMTIIQDYAISKAKVEGDAADVLVEYTAIGEIDDHFDFKLYVPSRAEPIKVRVSYHLVRQREAQRSSGATGVGAGESSGWRIEYASTPAYVHAESAIKYLLRVRDSDPLASNRQNAAKAIAILERQRKR